MKLIVGLGNPTEKYANTRHNTGFLTVDKIADKLNVKVTRKAFDALIGKINYKGEQVILMKPQTFMNESGRAVRKAVNYYHLDVEDILVIYDDLDLNYGKIRLRESGSSGGHNGIKSIIENIGTQKFKRIRIGIEKKGDVINYVLGTVEKEKQPLWQDAMTRAANAAIDFIDQPFQKVMNTYNKETDG